MTRARARLRSDSKTYGTGPGTPAYFPIHVSDMDGERDLTVVNLPRLARLHENGELSTVAIPGAPARGIPLFTNGHLGADLIYIEPGNSFPLHIHDGHHFLFCLKGEGTVTFDGKSIPIAPGDLYMIQGSIPHAVAATPDGPGHWLVSFGAPHTAIDSTRRMKLVERDDEG